MYQPTDPRSLQTPRTEFDQVTTATTLVALVQEDAPAVQWRLDVTGHYLLGQLMGPQAERHQGMAAWQRVIGAGPVASRPSGTDEYLTISGSYEGVPVEVSTIFDPKQALAERIQRAAQELDDADGATLTGADLRALLEEDAA